MKTEKQIKAAAKAFFTFYRKNYGKLLTYKWELHPGFTITAKYSISSWGEIDVEELDYKASKDVNEFLDKLGVDIESHIWDLDMEEIIDIVAITDKLGELSNALDEAVFDNKDSEPWSDYLDDGDETLEDFYSTVDQFIEERKSTPTSTVLDVSPDYSTRVVKGSDTIQVGCQKVPISNVRKILEEWDKLNG